MTTLHVARIVRPGELDAGDLERWRALQAEHGELDRPFFAPEWFRILDEVEHPVEVAVFAAGDRDVGFFPFHRDGRALAPPGARLSDFQGWIGPPDLAVDPSALVRELGASTWHFDHLLASQTAASRLAVERAPSPLADVSAGFEAYLASHRARGSGWVSQVPRKARKLGREVGELRFELSSRDPDVLASVREWKHAQRQRTRTLDPLSEPWAERAVEACLALEAPEFAGVLSALYAGDELVAAHIGLRSRASLHIWFPAYSVARERYSPGLILFFELIRAAADAGIGRVDFGKGRDQYKESWKTGDDTVVVGFVAADRFTQLGWQTLYSGRRWLRRVGAADAVRGPRRRLRSLVRGR